MGRRCHCEKLFQRLEGDVRLRTLPMAAQFLWLKLMRLAATTPGFDGVLRFGSDLGFLTAVSVAVSHAETEVETALGALERRGLVEPGADGESLRLPDAEHAAARTEAARVNGLRGGRPRKGETREAYNARRQGAFMLPLQGGVPETQETETEPAEESSRLAANPSESEEGSSKPREAPWVSLGTELAAIAGLDGARGGFNLMPVKGWVDAGASPDLLRDVLRRCAARPGYRPVRSLQYFHQAVMDAMREAAPPEPAQPTTGYAEAMRAWQRGGCQGIPPSLAEWKASQVAA
jgi:hypothetical protein